MEVRVKIRRGSSRFRPFVAFGSAALALAWLLLWLVAQHPTIYLVLAAIFAALALGNLLLALTAPGEGG